MPALVITRPAAPMPPKRMRIISDAGVEWTFPHAPVGFDMSGLAARWATVDRPGRDPLVEYQGGALPVMSVSWTLAYEDERSIEPDLRTLRGIAASKSRVRFDAGPSQAGWWRITDHGAQPLDEDEAYNTTVAAVTLEVTRATEAVVNVGPVTGGAKTTPVGQKPKEVVAAAGDTLRSLALRYLGDGARWKTIADLNGITDVRGRPRVGERIRLP